MKILSVNNGRTGCDYYRLQVPLSEISRHGHAVMLPDPTDPPIGHDSLSGPLAGPDDHGMPTDQALEWADIVLARQVSYPGLVPHWQRWRAFAPTVYDTDDDIFHVDTSNPALGVFLHPGVEEAIKQMLRAASLVTVTTVHLAGVMAAHTDRPIAVLPNYVEGWTLDLPPHDKPDPRVTVGWTASSSHYRDLYRHAGPLRRWLLDNPNVRFLNLGVDYRNLIEVPTAEHRGWLPIRDYYHAIGEFDVGIAPLEPNTFNQSKSHLKALEYAARGVPVVASAGTAYDDFVEDGVTGLLVRRPEDWARHLSALTNDQAMREEMGRAAKKQAASWTIENNWQAWVAAYELATQLT